MSRLYTDVLSFVQMTHHKLYINFVLHVLEGCIHTHFHAESYVYIKLAVKLQHVLIFMFLDSCQKHKTL
jgi:hypothetical protein